MVKSFLASFLLGLLSAKENFQLTIRHETISAPCAMNIVHLSDIHYPKQGVSLKSIVTVTKRCSPDIICLSGDLLDGSVRSFDESLRIFLEGLLEIAPIYYVRGNHEIRINNLLEIEASMTKLGVTHLRREQLDKVCLIGLDELNRYEVLKLDPSCFNIVLAHHPEDVKFLKKYESLDLMLSGHGHGGQIRIGNQGLFAPGQGILPSLTKGLHVIHGRMRVNISAGIGMSSFKQRINNHPEIVLLRLVNKE